jgi:hypothetical protein
MFRRSSDGISVPASIRLNDGAMLLGAINCGMSGKLDLLLGSDVAFIEFVSKDGQQRFLARHQIASIEPIGSFVEPKLPPVAEDGDAFGVLGLKPDDNLDRAMAAFQNLMRLYNPERWTGEHIPFEISRYAAEKTRQINMAFTIVRAAIQSRAEDAKSAKLRSPLFGGQKAVV